MADPEVSDPPNEPGLDHPSAVDFQAEFDPVPILSLDEQFFSSNEAASLDDFFPDPGLGLGLGFELDENCDYELCFDDIDDFLIPDAFADDSLTDPGVVPRSEAGAPPKSASPESGSSAVSGIGDYGADELLDCRNSGSQKLNSQFPDSGNSEREFSGGGGGPVSSQGSGVSEGGSSPVYSGDFERGASSRVFSDQKVKLEATGRSNSCVPKRKKEAEEEGNSESRTPKYRKSCVPTAESTGLDEEDEKKKARLMRNRESAQLSRQRKKHYVEELEDKVRNMNSTINDLNSRISYIMAENASLRQQLGGAGTGMCPPPPPGGMYPHPAMGPMAYPWVPCAPYVMKPQGSHVPLVPIPRLKPQQTVSAASKIKKPESKKSESGKTKKVASVSFLGLLFFVLLFGGLVPIVNINFGGFVDKVPVGSGYVNGRLYDQHRGRVLTVDDGSKRSGENVGVGLTGKGKGSHSDEFTGFGNGSEPLVASLYVPRNDKMVKIDGNLIIHSVLASEKTKASLARLEMKRNTETRLAIARNVPPRYAVAESGEDKGRRVPFYRNPTERQKALSSGEMKNHLKSSAADGRLQQWFREGLAGPMLSSGMCTEVFQFNVSPASTSGAIVPASSVPNVSTKQTQNATQNGTRLNESSQNRRTLGRLPVPLPDSNYNITDKHGSRSSHKDEFQGNRSVSSMVVSVLVDPREAGTDGEIDGMMKPKSLSRIFVVVLIDSVKYVTYSCVLPRSSPHLVTA